MTKEDVPESSQGDSVQDRHQNLDRPVVHQVASAPMPLDCEFTFFDPSEPQCHAVLLDPQTTVPELFAVLRQWVPQVQRNIGLIGNEILKRGCGINDRDGLTDMSLLHYCCKAGAPGIGDAEAAAGFARQLLSLGAEIGLRSRWTDMSALHYAAYFDVPELIRVVLEAAHPGEVDATCSDFDFGTALHIAASNLCISAVKCLLQMGANPAFRNDKGQCPADVVPEPLDMPLEMADAAAQAKALRTLLREALPQLRHPAGPPAPGVLSDSARAQLLSMGIRVGDRVVIAGQKVGTLRFCGSTEFAGGQWAGVELDDAEGKNNGSVAGVQYFTCPPRHGIFAPLSKISKPPERRKHATVRNSTPGRQARPDLSHVTSKINTGSRSRTPSVGSPLCDSPDVRLGERVLVVGQRTGVVRFSGNTNFAPGFWVGIELDKPSGKNDGSVGGVCYFTCPPKHGIFAPPSRVQRIHGSVDCLSELSSSRLHKSLGGIRRTLSSSSAFSMQKEQNRRSPVSRTRTTVLRQRWSAAGSGSPGGTDGGARLHVGMQVLLCSANEMAVVRYLGAASFAPGLWLGLELRGPKGTALNDHHHKRFPGPRLPVVLTQDTPSAASSRSSSQKHTTSSPLSWQSPVSQWLQFSTGEITTSP
uniref:Si:dkeyp-47f9.4 n=1 Tax=Paramormyrops kingsleyae TaxID=1676925 RepID=A0A3B3QMQ8_9TELE